MGRVEGVGVLVLGVDVVGSQSGTIALRGAMRYEGRLRYVGLLCGDGMSRACFSPAA